MFSREFPDRDGPADSMRSWLEFEGVPQIAYE